MKLNPAPVALVTLAAILVGCVGPAPHYGQRDYESRYDYDEEPAPTPPERQGLTDAQKFALGLGAAAILMSGGGGGNSNESEDVAMCSRCGSNPADEFLGICGQCASIQNEQNWGR